MSVLLTSRSGDATGTFQNPSASDEAEYDRLRSLARAAHAKRNSCFERSRAAYASGQKALAKELSVEGKGHGSVGDDYHRQARDYIFRVNNSGRAGDEIDLHGLYVQEAKEILGTRIRAEQSRGGAGLHVIVGKGNHSEGGIQKIKPAVEELCRELNLQFSTEHNVGRMYISLAPVDGGQSGEVPAGNHPHGPYHAQGGYDTYAQHQQPQHGSSGASGGAWPGQQGSSSSGYGSSGHQQQQQQQHQHQHQHHHQHHHHHQQHYQQQQQSALANDVVVVAKKAFFKKLATSCVVM